MRTSPLRILSKRGSVKMRPIRRDGVATSSSPGGHVDAEAALGCACGGSGAGNEGVPGGGASPTDMHIPRHPSPQRDARRQPEGGARWSWRSFANGRRICDARMQMGGVERVVVAVVCKRTSHMRRADANGGVERVGWRSFANGRRICDTRMQMGGSGAEPGVTPPGHLAPTGRTVANAPCSVCPFRARRALCGVVPGVPPRFHRLPLRGASRA